MPKPKVKKYELKYFHAFLNTQMCGDTTEMRELASRICKDYLNGAWKSVNANNVGFKHIRSVFSILTKIAIQNF